MRLFLYITPFVLPALLGCQSGQPPTDTAPPPMKPAVEQPLADTAHPAALEQPAPKTIDSQPPPAPVRPQAPAVPQPATPPAAPPAESAAEPERPAAPDHAQWDALLQRHVDSKGTVDYRGFQADQQRLAEYLQTLAGLPPQPEWSRQEKMAYWINAYNAFTVALIAEHYPLKSILDLDNGKTWDVPRIRLGEKNYSLNQIENAILRPQFKDARIHFALNCAARSCPPLWNRAFSAEALSQELGSRTRGFINHSGFNTLGEAECQVSKLFEWYAEDFGDLRSFLNQYAKKQIPETAVIRFGAYDWSLND